MQWREVPPTPRSAAGGWLRRGSSSGFEIGAQSAQTLQKRPPFLSGVSLRANLGSLRIDVRGDGGSPASGNSAVDAPTGSSSGAAARPQSAFADASQQGGAVAEWAAGVPHAAPLAAGMRRLLTVSGTEVTLLPQPPGDGKIIEFEGARLYDKLSLRGYFMQKAQFAHWTPSRLGLRLASSNSHERRSAYHMSGRMQVRLSSRE